MSESNPVNDALVITVSDSCARGEGQDRSGPEACGLLRAAGLRVDGPEVLPDERDRLAARLREAALALSAGGDHGGHRPRPPAT